MLPVEAEFSFGKTYKLALCPKDTLVNFTCDLEFRISFTMLAKYAVQVLVATAFVFASPVNPTTQATKTFDDPELLLPEHLTFGLTRPLASIPSDRPGCLLAFPNQHVRKPSS